MKFQIKKLIVWRKGETGEKREVKFLTDKVNIITGASQTGKSAIIHIIDYCLGSDKCPVPAGVVRENASWYGLVIVCQDKQYLLARRNPDDNGDEGSDDYYISSCVDDVIPDHPKATQTTQDAKELLNDLAKMPTSGHDELGWGSGRLSFRDVMALVFQYQGTVANQYMMFGKMHDTAHRKILETWIDYILGAENMNLITDRMVMQAKKREHKALERDYAIAKAQLNEWLGELKSQLLVAKKYGLLGEDENVPDDIPGILRCAKTVVDNDGAIPLSSWKDLQAVIDKIAEFEKTEEKKALELAAVDKRIAALQRFQESLAIYGGGQKLKREHLNIHAWFEKNQLSGEHICPFCGSATHTRATEEMTRIKEEIVKCENKAKNAPPIKDLYLRELESLKKDHDRLNLELKQLRQELSESRGMLSEYKQRSKDVYMIIGQMKATVQLDMKLAVSNDVVAKIIALDEAIRALAQKVKDEEKEYKESIERIWHEVCDRTLHYLTDLKVEKRYKKFAPEFVKSEMSLLVHDANGETHGMDVLGSGSNWVGYHIAFMTAIHEYLTQLDGSKVPSFCVFDQPSQVHGAEKEQDIEAVRSIIKTLAEGIRSTNGVWQVILVEHATEETYKGIEGAEEIENWWNGNKLIPDDWIDNG